MSREVGELLGTLKEKNVIDFEESLPIILIDRSSSKIFFEKTHQLRVKRFTSLVARYIPVLHYLSKHLTYENNVVDVKRDDRIMGAINYRKTCTMHQGIGDNSIICSEIHKNFNTPENIFLVIILLSIIFYCAKYIKLEGLVESNRLNPTKQELITIHMYVSKILSTRIIKQIVPSAIESTNKLNELLQLTLTRLYTQKIPKKFANIIKLFYYWKYFIWLAYNDKEIAKDVLYYHFMNLDNTNDLYECWVFTKILYEISKKKNVKLKQIRASKGLVTFTTMDNSLRITYQVTYATPWIYKDKFIEDNPDIVIEKSDGTCFILDAKNSYYSPKNLTPNLHQMRSYLSTTNSNYGIFIHSNSQDPKCWQEIFTEKGQNIVWTSLIPGTKSISLENITSLILAS